MTMTTTKVNMYVYLKVACNWTTNMEDIYGKKSISPILVLLLFVQFQTLYLKTVNNSNLKLLHTGWVPRWDVQSVL